MEWISVKSSLPYDYWKELIVCNNIYSWTCVFDGEYFIDPDLMYKYLDVTHWMPLPEPPKQ